MKSWFWTLLYSSAAQNYCYMDSRIARNVWPANRCFVLLMLHRRYTMWVQSRSVYPVVWSILMSPAIISLWLGGAVNIDYILAIQKQD